jgi:hypothetical protein
MASRFATAGGMADVNRVAQIEMLDDGCCVGSVVVHVVAVEAAFPGTTDGHRVDRQKLSAALLNNPRDFQRLEAIVHPLVFAAERAFLREQAERGAKFALNVDPLHRGEAWLYRRCRSLMAAGGGAILRAIVALGTLAAVRLREALSCCKKLAVSYPLAIGINPDTGKQIAACRLIESKRAQTG